MKKRFARLFGEDCPNIPEFRTINGVSSKIIDFYAKSHSNGNAFQLMADERLYPNWFPICIVSLAANSLRRAL